MSSAPVASGSRPQGDSANKAWLRALELNAAIERTPQRVLARVIDEQADARPDAPALLSDGQSLTYADLAKRMHRYARWALLQGFQKGDAVALIAGNSPDYM